MAMLGGRAASTPRRTSRCRRSPATASTRSSITSSRLPEGPMYFPDDEVSDMPEDQWVAELVREQLLAVTKDELPYSIATRVTSGSGRASAARSSSSARARRAWSSARAAACSRGRPARPGPDAGRRLPRAPREGRQGLAAQARPGRAPGLLTPGGDSSRRRLRARCRPAVGRRWRFGGRRGSWSSWSSSRSPSDEQDREVLERDRLAGSAEPSLGGRVARTGSPSRVNLTWPTPRNRVRVRTIWATASGWIGRRHRVEDLAVEVDRDDAAGDRDAEHEPARTWCRARRSARQTGGPCSSRKITSRRGSESGMTCTCSWRRRRARVDDPVELDRLGLDRSRGRGRRVVVVAPGSSTATTASSSWSWWSWSCGGRRVGDREHHVVAAELARCCRRARTRREQQRRTSDDGTATAILIARPRRGAARRIGRRRRAAPRPTPRRRARGRARPPAPGRARCRRGAGRRSRGRSARRSASVRSPPTPGPSSSTAISTVLPPPGSIVIRVGPPPCVLALSSRLPRIRSNRTLSTTARRGARRCDVDRQPAVAEPVR